MLLPLSGGGQRMPVSQPRRNNPAGGDFAGEHEKFVSCLLTQSESRTSLWLFLGSCGIGAWLIWGEGMGPGGHVQARVSEDQNHLSFFAFFAFLAFFDFFLSTWEVIMLNSDETSPAHPTSAITMQRGGLSGDVAKTKHREGLN